MRPMLIIQTGNKLEQLSGVPGDFADWMLETSGWFREDSRTVFVHQDEHLPGHDEVCGVIVTGSGAMVTDHAPWIESAAEWLRRCRQQRVPVLGICFGHQLLAYAFGGEVGENPNGVEVGTVTIELTGGASADSLFADLPERFPAQASHRQSVLTLPADALHLASSERDPNHGFVIDEHLWGVQFHPEFNCRIVRGYVDHYRTALAQQGDDADALSTACGETPVAASLLQRFAEQVRGSQT